jgi:hypothetical protein
MHGPIPPLHPSPCLRGMVFNLGRGKFYFILLQDFISDVMAIL